MNGDYFCFQPSIARICEKSLLKFIVFIKIKLEYDCLDILKFKSPTPHSFFAVEQGTNAHQLED